MNSKGSSLAPLFLTGVAAAVVAEMAFGLLLYEFPGFLSALTLVAGVELAALATGLAARPEEGARGGRWRWFFAVGTVLIAGFAAVAWSFEVDLMASGTTRGYSLAALAALPMYGCGLVISGLPVARGQSAGVPAVAGAALGVGLTGTVLLVRLQPFGVYLFAVFCLAVAAFITAGQVAYETREAIRAVKEARRREAELAQAGLAQAEQPLIPVTPSAADENELVMTPADLAPADPAPEPGLEPDTGPLVKSPQLAPTEAEDEARPNSDPTAADPIPATPDPEAPRP